MPATCSDGEEATPFPSGTPVEQVVLIDGPEGDTQLAAWSAQIKEGLGSRAVIVHEAAVEDLTATEGLRVIGEAIAALSGDGFGAVITPGDAVAAGVIAMASVRVTSSGSLPASRLTAASTCTT